MNGTEEVPCTQVLQFLYLNINLSDVTLRAMDGLEIECNRCVLAARSPVFRAMMPTCCLPDTVPAETDGNGDEEEPCGRAASLRRRFRKKKQAHDKKKKKNPVLDVACTGDVAEMIVEYIYLGRVTLLDSLFCHYNFAGLAALACASKLYALPLLCQTIEQRAAALMEQDPSLVIRFLAAPNGGRNHEKEQILLAGVEQVAMDRIRKRPEIHLNLSSLASISETKLEQLVKTEVKANAYAQWLAVKTWANNGRSGGESKSNFNTVASWLDAETNPRQRTAATLVEHHIDLGKIDPAVLSNEVMPSGLVTTERILDAYDRAQTMMLKAFLQDADADTSPVTPVRGRRQIFNWLESKSPVIQGPPRAILSKHQGNSLSSSSVVELLDCPILEKGIQIRWSIHVEAFGGSGIPQFGLVLSVHHRRSQTQARIDPGKWWSYGKDGWAFHYGIMEPVSEHAHFQAGSTVTFWLDLRDGCSGTLSAAVDDEQTPSLLFSDLLLVLAAQSPVTNAEKALCEGHADALEPRGFFLQFISRIRVIESGG